jgi:hypothetical protein
VAKATVIRSSARAFRGLRNEKTRGRFRRGPRATQQILFLNSYTSLLTILYHVHASYLAVNSPSLTGLVRGPLRCASRPDMNGYSRPHLTITQRCDLFSAPDVGCLSDANARRPLRRSRGTLHHRFNGYHPHVTITPKRQ